MLQYLKPYKKILLTLFFIVVVLRALLHPIMLNSKLQGALDNLYPGKIVLSSLSFDFSGKIYIRNFQIIQDGEQLLNADDVSVEIEFWPSLFGEVVVKKVNIDNLHFRWLIDDEGYPYWQKTFKKGGQEGGEGMVNFIMNSNLNIQHFNAIYQMPQRNKQGQVIAKSSFEVIDAKIEKGALKFDKANGMDFQIPINSPAINNMKLSFKNNEEKFTFKVESPRFAWNDKLSKTLPHKIANPIDFLKLKGQFKYEMEYINIKKDETRKWSMSVMPIMPDPEETTAPIINPTMSPKGFNLPIKIKKGELTFAKDGTLALYGMEFYYKNTAGLSFLKGKYYLKDRETHIHIDHIDVSRKEIIDGLPPGISKIIKKLKPDKPMSAYVKISHSHPENNSIELRFKDLSLLGVSPTISKLTGSITFNQVDFEKGIYKGRANFSSLESLKTKFGDVKFPIHIVNKETFIGNKEESLEAFGQWSYAKGHIHILKEKILMDLDIQGLDLNAFQRHNDLATKSIALKGLINAKIHLDYLKGATRENKIGHINAKLRMSQEEFIDCNKTFAISSVVKTIVSPIEWFKIFGDKAEKDGLQKITGGELNFIIYPHKLELKNTILGGRPYNLGVTGSIRYGLTGKIKLHPAMGIVPIPMPGIPIEWRPDQIKFNGDIIWKEKSTKK